MLSRAKRAKITIRCMKKLYSQCMKRKGLFTDKDADDLMEEIGIHIWINLIKYRKKPYKQALKLAMTIGVNRLTSIVRSKLTVARRGSAAIFVNKSIDDLYWLTGNNLHSNGVQMIEMIEAIVSAAIAKVGVRKSDALVRSLLYDWRRRNITTEQKAIMETLSKTRKEMKIVTSRFISQIQSDAPKLKSTNYNNLIQKYEGRWRSPEP